MRLGIEMAMDNLWRNFPSGLWLPIGSLYLLKRVGAYLDILNWQMNPKDASG